MKNQLWTTLENKINRYILTAYRKNVQASVTEMHKIQTSFAHKTIETLFHITEEIHNYSFRNIYKVTSHCINTMLYGQDLYHT